MINFHLYLNKRTFNINQILLSLKSITSHECTSNPDRFLQLMKFITGGKWGVIPDTDITTHGNLRSCNSLQHTKLLSDKAVRGSNLTKAKYNIINAELNNQNASHLPPTFSWETQGGKLVIWQGRVVNNISTTEPHKLSRPSYGAHSTLCLL